MTKKNQRIELSDDDWQKINAACQVQCTGEEIAQIMGFSYDTLERRIKETHSISAAEYIKRHAQGGKATLRRLQWKAANNGNTSMLIWLGKQYLGQVDRQEQHTGATAPKLSYRRITANAAS
jgi:hypothetical protein